MSSDPPKPAASGPLEQLVAKYEGKRTRPMKVLCFGVSKTATMSMYTALQELGLHPYHMIEAVGKAKRDFPLWEEAIRAKYEYYGPLWTRRDFDVVLGDFDATLDTPTVMFVEELLAAYPDAKVVLTNRDADKWVASMRDSMGVLFSWGPSWELVGFFDRWIAGPWWSFVKLSSTHYCGTDYRPNGGAKRYFAKHYAHVRAVVPKDRLLEHAPTDGYGPLCKFLNLPVPDTPYPHVNDGDNFIKVHKMLWWQAFVKMVLMCASPFALTALVGYFTGRGAFSWLPFKGREL